MRKFALVLATLTMIFPVMSYAQKTCTASGEYTYYAASNESPDQARAIALERAKNQIIADNFGTVVGISNSTVVSNEGGKSDVRFLSFGESEVRGEWLETIGEPRFSLNYDPQNDMLVVKVSVKGRIREITSSRIRFDARILRNGTDRRSESDKFTNNDDLFVSFETPTSGYLAIFLYDGSTVSRLLPLQGSGEGSCEVRGGKEYVFFRRDDGKSFYHMTCAAQTEVNRFYIVFSPNKFTRPLDSRQDEALPAELGFEDFNHWLVRCRKQDVELGVLYRDVTISSR